jgi:HSP20 family protein
MTLMRRPSPYGEFLSLRNAMDRLFDERLFQPFVGGEDRVRGIPLDIRATPDAIVIEAALPGVRPEDVEISVLGDTLTLTAGKESEHEQREGQYLYREVRRGRSSRTVTLPSGLRTGDATASFENGMLRLSIPKAEQAKPRHIPISGTSEGTAMPVAQVEAQSEGRTTDEAGA